MRLPRRNPSPRAQRGFTMTEIIVVVVIVAILAAMAAPSMSAMLKRQRVKNAAFDVFAGLVLARSEAIKRNTTVTVSPNAGDWTKGWTATEAAGGTVVARQDPYTNITIAGPTNVVFTGAGRLAAAVTSFDLSATNVAATSFRCVSVDLSGRPVSKEGAC